MELEITKEQYKQNFLKTSRYLEFAYHKLTAFERQGLKGLLSFQRDQRIKNLDDLAFNILFHSRSPSTRLYEALKAFRKPSNKRVFSQLLKSLNGLPALLDHAWERFKYSVPDRKSDNREFANHTYDAYNRLKSQIPLLREDISVIETGLRRKAWFRDRVRRGSSGKLYNRSIVLAVRDLFHSWNQANDAKLIASVLSPFGIRIHSTNILRTIKDTKQGIPILPELGGAKAARFHSAKPTSH